MPPGPSPGAPGPGEPLGRYEVLGPLGTGEVAEVVLLRHLSLGTLAAMKRVDPGSEEQARRLQQDARAQAAIRHENLVQVVDLVQVEGAPALVVEFVSGPTLDRLLADRRLSLDQALDLGTGILAGMAEVHDLGLVHGDLKPRSVIVELGEAGPVPKVGDLGLAEIVTTREDEGLVGLPAYRPPEVLAGSEPGPRADVYAMGAILYELITGRRPHTGEDAATLLLQARQEDHPPLAHRVPQLSSTLAELIEACLAADPERRPADAVQLLLAWQQVRRRKPSWPPLDLLRPPLSVLGWDPDAGRDPQSSEVLLPVVPPPTPAPRALWLALALLALLLLGAAVGLLLR